MYESIREERATVDYEMKNVLQGNFFIQALSSNTAHRYAQEGLSLLCILLLLKK